MLCALSPALSEGFNIFLPSIIGSSFVRKLSLQTHLLQHSSIQDGILWSDGTEEVIGKATWKTGWTQRVVANGTWCAQGPTTSRASQVSLLFSVFITDLGELRQVCKCQTGTSSGLHPRAGPHKEPGCSQWYKKAQQDNPLKLKQEKFQLNRKKKTFSPLG